MKIYILNGSTGEYSDRSDWIVMAFKDKYKAEDASMLANDEAHKVFQVIKDCLWESIKPEVAALLTVDPKAQFDYTGTSYWITETELI